MIDLEKLSKEKAPLIDKELASVFSGNVPSLHDAIKYHLGTGGKRLRPLLSIVTYEALGGKDNKILPFAAACELFHNWCLPRDAKILTNPGKPKVVTEIKPGDMVYTFDGKNRTISRNRVSNVMETGQRMVYEIKTTNRKLVATGEHPILVCEKNARIYMNVDHGQLNNALKSSGYTIRKLALELGVKKHEVIHWIYGKTPIESKKFAELQKKLGVLNCKVSRSKRYSYNLRWKMANQLSKGDLIVISTNLPDDGVPYKLIKVGKFKLTQDGIKALSEFKPFRKKDLEVFGINYKKIHSALSGKQSIELKILERVFDFYKIPLKEHYYGFSRIMKKLNYPSATTEGFCQIIGFFLGDGFVNKNTIYFSQPKGEVRDHYTKLFYELFGRKLTENVANDCQLACYSKPIAELFRSLDICHRALEKRIPGWVFTLPKSQKLAFLRGYLDSDGTINKQSIARFACGSRELIEDMKILLDSLGFVTGNVGRFIVKNTFERGSKKESTIWYVLVSNSEKILEEIGTETAEYRRRLLVSRKRHTKFLHEIPRSVVDREFFGFNPVICVKKRGIETVYNLEVEDAHNFIANNVVVHNCLVHDDIMDGDRMRRDKPTVWVKYGLAHGINVGDYMAQKVFELIIKSSGYGVDDKTVLKLMDAMVTTSVRTAEGQTMDINMRSGSPKESDYMDMVMAKTGHYLTVPMVGAAIVADREEIIPKLVELGSFIGPAFQIADDILDLTEGKGRGEIGRDIKEGKKSILIIYCLSKCSAKEKKLLLETLEKTPEATTNSDVSRVVALLNKYNSLDYAKKKAEELKKKAYVSIKKMPPELQEIMTFFADYLVNRKK